MVLTALTPGFGRTEREVSIPPLFFWASPVRGFQPSPRSPTYSNGMLSLRFFCPVRFQPPRNLFDSFFDGPPVWKAGPPLVIQNRHPPGYKRPPLGLYDFLCRLVNFCPTTVLPVQRFFAQLFNSLAFPLRNAPPSCRWYRSWGSFFTPSFAFFCCQLLDGFFFSLGSRGLRVANFVAIVRGAAPFMVPLYCFGRLFFKRPPLPGTFFFFFFFSLDDLSGN